jgi:hypothetical protein
MATFRYVLFAVALVGVGASGCGDGDERASPPQGAARIALNTVNQSRQERVAIRSLTQGGIRCYVRTGLTVSMSPESEVLLLAEDGRWRQVNILDGDGHDLLPPYGGDDWRRAGIDLKQWEDRGLRCRVDPRGRLELN